MTRVVGADFGPIVCRFEVADAVEATLVKWQAEYLAEIERQTGLDEGHPTPYLPEVLTWERSMDSIRAHIGSYLPVGVISVRALVGEPTRRKTGTSVKFGLMLTVAASGGSQRETEKLADLYIAAFRALLEHNKTLGGFASSLSWVDERYDELGQPNDRDTLGAGSSFFEVEVEQVVNSFKGPKGDPLADPYGTIRGALPTVAEDGVNVTTTPTNGG